MKYHRSINKTAQHFTLIELLAAMAVLLLLMVMLFTFFASAQRAWSATETNTRIFENARLAFEIVGRDLQSAVCSQTTLQEIPFLIGQHDANGNTDKIAFVSSRTPPGTGATGNCAPDLAEVNYELGTAANAMRLRRGLTYYGSPPSPSGWDFYRKTAATDATGLWASTNLAANYHTIIAGVESLSFRCYDATGTLLGNNTAVTMLNQLPQVITVTITLVDEQKASAPTIVRDRTKRTFTKVIYVGGRG